jgi:hypothetical protein
VKNGGTGGSCGSESIACQWLYERKAGDFFEDAWKLKVVLLFEVDLADSSYSPHLEPEKIYLGRFQDLDYLSVLFRFIPVKYDRLEDN